MKESTTFDDNEEAFKFACDLFEFMDTTEGVRVAIIERVGFNENDQKSVFQLIVEAKEPITGYAFGDVSTQNILSEGDLVGVKVIKILKWKPSFFSRKYDLALCHIASLLEPTFDPSQGWKIKKHISPMLNQSPEEIWRHFQER